MAELNYTLSNILNVTNSFEVNPPQRISHIVNTINQFSYSIEHNINQQLTVINNFIYIVNKLRQISHTLNVSSSFTYSIDDPNFIGTTIPNIDKPPINSSPGTTNPPGVGPLNIGTLRYAPQFVILSSGGHSISFKSPDFGDKKTLTERENNEDTRGLTLIQYRDPIWADFNTYDLSFSQLDEEEAQLIKQFLRNTTGKIITYSDIYGNSHVGFILDPDTPLTSSIEGYSIKFIFLEAPGA